MEILEIKPSQTNLSINGRREQAFTEIVGHFCNIGTKIRQCAMKFD